MSNLEELAARGNGGVNNTQQQYLSVDSASLNTSPSASTFLPDQNSSTCLLLPNSPSPDPELTHPLTPGLEDASEPADNGADDANSTNSSSGSSGGINMVVMIDTDQTNTNDFNINNRKGNNYNHNNKSPEFCMDNKKTVTKVGDILITCTDQIPPFVDWNWPLIRKWSFSLFLCINIGVIGFVIAMMSTLPKTCNPPKKWYQGSVFYEIQPHGLKDLYGRVQYFKDLEVSAVRLNSIFPKDPHNQQGTTTYFSIDQNLGDFADFESLVYNLQHNGIKLILDLPLSPLVKKLHVSEHVSEIQGQDTNAAVQHHLSAPGSTTNDNLILKAIKFWTEKGVDGFYVKDLEQFHNDSFLLSSVKEWKFLLGDNRCLIVSSALVDAVKHNKTLLELLLPHIDLVDTLLDVNGTSAKVIGDQIADAITGHAGLSSTTWLHWTINRRDLPLIYFEMLLPGTINLYLGEKLPEFASTEPHLVPPNPPPWLPKIQELIALRNNSPSIYLMHFTRQNQESKLTPTTNIRQTTDDLIAIERHYPRRLNYAVVTNRSNKTVHADLSDSFFSGDVIVGPATQNSKIFFREFEIASLDTIIVKLDK
ncbi:amino acid transporter heavy chain SLC3A2-like [Culicoides brevitarsis]|uniref:amino acid transporter heavy chain SLC3A2-like n=1 Tax=Culicoides brevitarsis TaxID=469753 RepID=UPI00307CA580